MAASSCVGSPAAAMSRPPIATADCSQRVCFLLTVYVARPALLLVACGWLVGCDDACIEELSSSSQTSNPAPLAPAQLHVHIQPVKLYMQYSQPAAKLMMACAVRRSVLFARPAARPSVWSLGFVCYYIHVRGCCVEMWQINSSDVAAWHHQFNCQHAACVHGALCKQKLKVFIT
jgi:hypothetical protein